MRRYPNLLGDLSAVADTTLARDEVCRAIPQRVQDRLFFGTDICAPDTPTPLVDFLLRLRDEKKISETVFEKVARGNAKSFSVGIGGIDVDGGCLQKGSRWLSVYWTSYIPQACM